MHSLPTNHELISLQIKGVFIPQVIDFLIEKKIHFWVSYDPQTSTVDQGTEKQYPMDTSAKSLGIEQKKEQMQSIYRKYLVDEMEGPPVKVKKIAFELGIPEAEFNHKFRKYFGKSFYQVYMEKRMEYAAGLLKAGYRASEVSKKIGYTQPIKFNKMFQKYFGMTPYKYQKSTSQQ